MDHKEILFGQQKETFRSLVNNNAAEILARLVRKENNEVAEQALRTLCEYSKYCNSEFVGQLITAQVLDKMMTLIDGEDAVLSQYSFTIFLRISSKSTARPELGRVGVITCFRDMILNDSRKNKTLDILSAFCLLCRESVNRERIICNEGLELLVNCLLSDKYKLLHDRIISAIVCFIYDTVGLQKLLDLGLVQALLPHLERAASYQCRKFDDFNFTTPNENCPRSEQDATSNKAATSCDAVVEDVAPSTKELTGNQVCNTKKRKVELEEQERGPDCVMINSLSEDTNRSIVVDNSTKKIKRQSDQECDKSLSAIMDIEQQNVIGFQSDTLTDTKYLQNLSAEDTPEAGKVSKNHVYSIDSPTYEVNNEWNLEDYSKGVKCKTSFQPLNVNMTPPRDRSYSPMSNSSLHYFSPGRQSPSSSSCASEFSEDSYGSLDEIYAPGSSTPSWCMLSSSEHYSDFETSSRESSFSRFDHTLNVSRWSPESNRSSPSDLETDLHPTSESMQTNQAESTATKEIAHCRLRRDLNLSCSADLASDSDMSGNSSRFVNVINDNNSRHDESTPNENRSTNKTSICSGNHNDENQFENTEDISDSEGESNIKKKVSRVVLPTENNILILLSRISLVKELVEYLVNVETISSLLEYISEVEIPMSRAERILLRIIRDPNCFVSLINMVAPALIYQRLSASQSDGCFTDISKFDLDWDIRNSSFTEEFQDVLDEGKCLKITNVRSIRHGPNFQLATYHKSPSLACRFLIHELRVMASSPFGHGELSHWMLTKDGLEKAKGAVSLLFLTRRAPMKEKYMTNMGAMRSACNVLLQQNDALMFQYAAYGLRFLAQMLLPDGLLHLKTTPELLYSPVSMPKPRDGRLECNYFVEHDVIFLLTDNRKISANRDAMATNSAVFSAMLEGHYAESSQSVVRVSDVSHDAMECIVHYLHGCWLSCAIMNSLFSTEAKLELCMNVIALADRYLLESLKSAVCGTVCRIHLNMKTVVCVFHFAIDHNLLPLSKDCILFILLSKEDADMMRVIVELSRSSYAEQFVDTLIQLLSERFGKVDCL